MAPNPVLAQAPWSEPLVPLGDGDVLSAQRVAAPVAARAVAPPLAAAPPVTRVIEITPANAAQVLPPATIRTRFDHPIDPASVTASSFRVTGGTRGVISGTYSFTSGNTEIAFTPDAPFARSETVGINLSSQILDVAGDAIRPFASQFAVRSVANAAEFAQGQSYGVGEKPLSVLAHDLDRDGFLDLILGNTSWQGSGASTTISVLKGLGNGTFAPKIDYPTDTASGPLPLGVAAGDLDGDGFSELVVANRGSATVAVLRNNGSGVFGAPQLYPVEGGPVRVEIGDLDGDGIPDLAVTHGGLNGGGLGVSLLFGNGDGTFGTPMHLNSGLTHWGLQLSDLDGDGRLDLVTGDSSTRTISAFKNLGGRNFDPPVSYPAGSGAPRDVAVADFNGDGWLDVVAANQQSSTITTYTNDGHGHFAGRDDNLVNGQPVGAIAVDLDGDGRSEIATANHFGGVIYSGSSATVWFSNGEAFDFHKEINTRSAQPIAIAAADFDNDGDLDLATANWGGNSVSILLNAPAGITGLAYLDADTNCTRNGVEEIGVAGRLVRVTDDFGVTRYEATRADGAFTSVVPAGHYRVSLVHNANTTESCDAGQGASYDVTVAAGAPVGGLQFSLLPGCNAIVTCMARTTGPCTHPDCQRGGGRTLCPCEPFQYAVTVVNNGTAKLGTITAQLQLDANVMFCSFPNPIADLVQGGTSSLIPSGDPRVTGSVPHQGTLNLLPCSPNCTPALPNSPNNTGQLIQWNLNGILLNSGDSCTFFVNVQVANVALSPVTTLNPAVNISGSCGFFPVIATSYPCPSEVRCSFDPNDKTVSPKGCGPSGNVPPGTPLLYRVRFQNLGTALARRVLIRDDLDPMLDADTLEIISTSHPLTDFRILPGGQMIWTFEGIDLPEAASDEAASQGEVRYRIRPKPFAGEGTVILNTAAIYFDRNPAIITVTTTNTIRSRPEPQAAFTARHSDTEAGLAYDFTYTGGTPDGATFAWDFGPDATPATATDREPAGIRFAAPGPKRVTLTVERYGCTTNVTQIVEAVFISLLCPSNVIAEATSPAGAQVAFNIAAAAVNCAGPVSIECVPPSGSEFPLGRTVVNCVAHDTCATTNTCSFTVDVMRPPIQLNCPGVISVSTVDTNGTVVSYTVTAQSRCEGNLPVQCLPPSGSLFPSGVTSVICATLDRCGTTNQCSFQVVVTRPPELHLLCPTSLVVRAASPAGKNVSFQVPAVGDCVDPFDPFGVLVECFPPSGSLFPVGLTAVSCSAQDFNCGLIDSCSFTVTVLDVTPLNLACVADKTVFCDGATIPTNVPIYTVLSRFLTNGIDGERARGGLVESSDGLLYGTTYDGGAGGYGTIYRLHTDGSGYAVLRSFGFTGTSGRTPFGGLVEGADGWLYGTTTVGSGGYGAVFKASKDGGNYLVLHAFTTTVEDGRVPNSGVIQGRDGCLYGTTSQGGEAARGTVFKLNTNGSGYTVLRRFATNEFDGDEPWGTLLEGRDGWLYGTTRLGGFNSAGTIFKLEKDGNGYTVLRRFTGQSGDGSRPYGTLVEGSDGWLYGTTQSGGTGGRGTVFKLSPDGGGYTVLRRFSTAGGDGGLPNAGLVEGRDGAMYGTCYDGGAEDRGTIFRLNKDGSGYTVLRSFSTNDLDARRPFAGLTLGRDGTMYGATEAGGGDGVGAIFKLEWPCAWSFDSPVVVNACGGAGNVTITTVSTVTNNTTPRRITRTWRATDACGNSTTCGQTVTVRTEVPALALAIHRNGGDVLVTWNRLGTLEQSSQPRGPWTPLASGTNSYTTTPGDTQKFFRARVP